MVDARRRRACHVPAAAFALLLLMACSAANAPSASPEPPAATGAGSVAATRTPVPSPTPLANLPSELIGTWETDLTEYVDPDPLCPNCNYGAETRLIIQAHGQYTVAGYGPYRPGGSFTIQDDLIIFDRSSRAGDTDCANATYSWELDGDQLTFRALEPDPCGRRGEALDGVTYTRAD